MPVCFQALQYLGLDLTPRHQEKLRERLRIDPDGTTALGGERKIFISLKTKLLFQVTLTAQFDLSFHKLLWQRDLKASEESNPIRIVV